MVLIVLQRVANILETSDCSWFAIEKDCRDDSREFSAANILKSQFAPEFSIFKNIYMATFEKFSAGTASSLKSLPAYFEVSAIVHLEWQGLAGSSRF